MVTAVPKEPRFVQRWPQLLSVPIVTYLKLIFKDLSFYFMLYECLACMYVSTHVCLVPVEAGGGVSLLELVLWKVVSSHVGIRN